MIGANARVWHLFRAENDAWMPSPRTKRNGRNPDPFDESAFRPSCAAGPAGPAVRHAPVWAAMK
ncbi:hypothetical protein, partial [Burkholderia cenocepacia]|uniref:hypothetical protein n=1 Tax=Burkholderia cenocepacia TaxID=95486 RepID=UPI00066745B9